MSFNPSTSKQGKKKYPLFLFSKFLKASEKIKVFISKWLPTRTVLTEVTTALDRTFGKVSPKAREEVGPAAGTTEL